MHSHFLSVHVTQSAERNSFTFAIWEPSSHSHQISPQLFREIQCQFSVEHREWNFFCESGNVREQRFPLDKIISFRISAAGFSLIVFRTTTWIHNSRCDIIEWGLLIRVLRGIKCNGYEIIINYNGKLNSVILFTWLDVVTTLELIALSSIEFTIICQGIVQRTKLTKWFWNLNPNNMVNNKISSVTFNLWGVPSHLNGS